MKKNHCTIFIFSVLGIVFLHRTSNKSLFLITLFVSFLVFGALELFGSIKRGKRIKFLQSKRRTNAEKDELAKLETIQNSVLLDNEKAISIIDNGLILGLFFLVVYAVPNVLPNLASMLLHNIFKLALFKYLPTKQYIIDQVNEVSPYLFLIVLFIRPKKKVGSKKSNRSGGNHSFINKVWKRAFVDDFINPYTLITLVSYVLLFTSIFSLFVPDNFLNRFFEIPDLLPIAVISTTCIKRCHTLSEGTPGWKEIIKQVRKYSIWRILKILITFIILIGGMLFVQYENEKQTPFFNQYYFTVTITTIGGYTLLAIVKNILLRRKASKK